MPGFIAVQSMAGPPPAPATCGRDAAPAPRTGPSISPRISLTWARTSSGSGAAAAPPPWVPRASPLFTTRLVKATAARSIWPVTPRALRDRKACSSSDGIATIRPNLVVISASEMPPDSVFTSPDPKIVISLKVLMMPVTVPSRPSSGAEAAQIAMKGRKRCSFRRVVRTTSYITSSISSRGWWRCSTPTRSIFPAGPLTRLAAFSIASSSRESTAASRAFTRRREGLRWNSIPNHLNSATSAAAPAMAKIGTITLPPFFTCSRKVSSVVASTLCASPRLGSSGNTPSPFAIRSAAAAASAGLANCRAVGSREPSRCSAVPTTAPPLAWNRAAGPTSRNVPSWTCPRSSTALPRKVVPPRASNSRSIETLISWACSAKTSPSVSVVFSRASLAAWSGAS